MEYITTKQAAAKWGISQRRVRVLCEQGKISGAIFVNNHYMIPSDAKKPHDNRFKPLSLDELYKSIEQKFGELKSRRPLTQGEVERLKEDFVIEYTYNTNAIEGSTLTLRETALVLQGLTINQKPLKEHIEATQHRDAFNYICELVEKKTPLSEEAIKNIHSIVLNDNLVDRGVYRRVSVRIMGSYHLPPQPVKIPSKMSNLVNEYNVSTENIIKKIALFHLRFEGIHPFVDGNGRAGRLIANMELMKAGYPPINIKFSERKNYYDSFNDLEEKVREEKMERLFAEYVLDAIEEYLKIIK